MEASEDVMSSLMEGAFGPSDDAPAEKRLAWANARLHTSPGGGSAAMRLVHHARPDGAPPPDANCFSCAAPKPQSRCAKCAVAVYCGRECQVAHWKTGHKAGCERLGKVWRAVADDGDDSCRWELVQALVASFRHHLSIFAVHHAGLQGCGFLLVESADSLGTLVLPSDGERGVRDLGGRPLVERRDVMVHFLTTKEYFDTPELSHDDRSRSYAQELGSAVERADPEHVAVVLLRTSCGSVYIIEMPLVPDAGICRGLAKDYAAGKDALQIDLDAT